MKLIKTEDYSSMSRKAANIISAQVIINPYSVIGLATGSTPLGTYRQLISWYEKGDLDFSCIRTVNLDEYKGLEPKSEQSYRAFMQKNLFNHINIKQENTHLPDGLAVDSDKECARYNAVIRNLGGVDLQLLGIGNNGHIGFNEPGEAFEMETHCVPLSKSTIDANSRFFVGKADVPRYAYTMGIKAIMQAKKILVIVSGQSKAEIVYRLVCGPVVPEVPASILQMHPDVTLVADKAALRLVNIRNCNT